MHNLIQILIPLLPRYPEEGSDASCIKTGDLKKELEEVLLEGTGDRQNIAVEAIVSLIQNLLFKLCLLDVENLERGEWKFVSHPAQLCALSLLNTLADPRQKLFPAGFWDTAGVGDTEKQQQKKVLQALEDRRQACHPDGNPPPIRFVYVAWGIIKLENKILFHQREASEHANEYGLIGGRANMTDLKQVMVDDQVSRQDLLKTLQTPYSEQMFKALEFSLHRECEEETGLLYAEDHYTVNLWRDIKPWQKCMGGAPNYALTEYFFRIYQINLTNTGYLALHSKLMEKNKHLLECSLEEVAQGKTTDGAKKLTIEVLYDDFSGDRQALKKELESLPPSYANRYTFSDDSDSLIFSLQNDILKGKAGKETPLKIALTPEQKSLLMGLAAHGKGFEHRNTTDANLFVFHSKGWIKIDNPDVNEKLNQISDLFRQAGFPCIEIFDQNYFRLSLSPNIIFFDPDHFRYELQEKSTNKWILRFNRENIPTFFGELLSDFKEASLTRNLAKELQEVAKSNSAVLASDNDDHLRKKIREAAQEVYQSLGLKRFLLIKEKHYAVAIRLHTTHPSMPS